MAQRQFCTRMLAFCLVFGFLIVGCAQRQLTQRRNYFETRQESDARFSAYHAYLTGKQRAYIGDIDRSIKRFHDTLDHLPHSLPTRVNLGLSYLRNGNLEGAKAEMQRVLEIDPDQPEALFLLGKMMLLEGKKEEAASMFSKILIIDPHHEDAKVALLNIYIQSNNYDEAHKILDSMLKTNPDDGVALYYKGRVYLETNDFPSAKKVLNKALSIHGDFAVALSALALVAELEENLKEAYDLYVRLIRIEPDNLTVTTKLVQIAISLERFDEALGHMSRLYEMDPSDDDIPLRIGLILIKLERYRTAIVWLERAVRINPASVKNWFYLGAVALQVNEFDRALKAFERVPADSELYYDVLLNKLLILESQGRVTQALKVAEEGMRLYPKSTAFIGAKAGILEYARRYDEAIAVLIDGLKRLGTNESLLFHLGSLYYSNGNTQLSIKTMRQVIEMNSNNASALNFLGYTYAEMAEQKNRKVNLREAELLILKALEINPKDGYITDSLGWVYFQQGKYEQALNKLKEANKLAPNEPIILEHLGDAYIEVMKLAKEEKAPAKKIGANLREAALESYRSALENNQEKKAESRLKKKIKMLLKNQTALHHSIQFKLLYS